MTKIITLVLDDNKDEYIKRTINEIITLSKPYIKSLQINEVNEKQLEVPKVFN